MCQGYFEMPEFTVLKHALCRIKMEEEHSMEEKPFTEEEPSMEERHSTEGGYSMDKPGSRLQKRIRRNQNAKRV